MNDELKVYRTAGGARLAAAGRPYLRIGLGRAKPLYIVGLDEAGLDEIALIAPTGVITGHVTTRHLDRLGNANRATANEVGPTTAYPDLADTLLRQKNDTQRY